MSREPKAPNPERLGEQFSRLDWSGGKLCGDFVFHDPADECSVADVIYFTGHPADGDSDIRHRCGSDQNPVVF